MDKIELLRRLKEIKVLETRQVNLKNAGESNFYINIKKAYGYPDILRKITNLMYRKIDRMTTAVAAQGYGAIPLATKLSTDYNLKLTLVRENTKDHGLQELLEGYIPNIDDKVFIVDDVFTTGNSIQEVIDALKPTKATIIGYGAVVKRDTGPLESSLQYIFTLDDFLN